MTPNQNSPMHALLRLAVSGLLLIGGAAIAGPGPAFYTGFESPDYDGSADGVSVNGQQGWYTPGVAGSVDQNIFTYQDNALGVGQDPNGEDQLLGGQTPAIGMFPRGQVDFDWSGSTVWTVSYDITNGFNGTLPATDNISSFSLQDSTIARYFIQVNTWSNPDTATNWDANYIVFDQFGTIADPPGLSPGAAWRNLAVGHWYNLATTFDFDSNKVTSVTIFDVETGDSTTYQPTGWYLAGGATSRPPLPTGLRFFVGGGNDMDGSPGNVGAFDNLEIDAVSVPSGNITSDANGAQRARGTKGATTN